MGQNNRGNAFDGASKRGFAAMDLAQRRAIASKGGSASGGNFRNDPARAAEAGRKGGSVSSAPARAI
jgi:uncharacterized protein